MPKTYNARQIADMKAQDVHAAPLFLHMPKPGKRGSYEKRGDGQ